MKKMNPIARRRNIVIQEFEKEVLLYDLEINKAFCLNETSALVFALSNGTRDAKEISDLMRKKLKSDVNEDFVWLALRELAKENLLENDVDLQKHFQRISRRELVKKVGFASVAALPIISSIVAPSAAAAQSGSATVGLLSFCGTINGVPQVCSSGLHCNNCLSCNTPNSSICCRNSNPSNTAQGSGPTATTFCTSTQSLCDTYITNNCCQGTGTFVTTPSCGGVGVKQCICD